MNKGDIIYLNNPYGGQMQCEIISDPRNEDGKISFDIQVLHERYPAKILGVGISDAEYDMMNNTTQVCSSSRQV